MFHRLLRSGRRQAIALIALFFALGGTSFAVAAGGSKSQTYYACVTKNFKTLNLTSKKGRCGRGETKISFNSEGPRGLRGLRGLQGADGAKGAPGTAGTAGAVGAAGAKGDVGAAGAKGDAGAAGARGDAGAAGARGDAGAVGATGPVGATGAVGATGSTGADGGTGPRGATGTPGTEGPRGPQGDRGTTGAQGGKGDKGDKGDTGQQGPAGPSGGAAVLKDANNVTLGTVLSASRTAVFIVTPKGFQVSVPVTGTFASSQVYFTGASCMGTGYLNDGSGDTGSAISGRTIIFSAAANGLQQLADVGADGTSRSVDFTSSSIDNDGCGTSAGTRTGWRLKPISRSDAGLPATIAAPLTIGG